MVKRGLGLTCLMVCAPAYPWLIVCLYHPSKDEFDPWTIVPANNFQKLLLYTAAPFRPILEAGRKLTFCGPKVNEEGEVIALVKVE